MKSKPFPRLRGKVPKADGGRPKPNKLQLNQLIRSPPSSGLSATFSRKREKGSFPSCLPSLEPNSSDIS